MQHVCHFSHCSGQNVTRNRTKIPTSNAVVDIQRCLPPANSWRLVGYIHTLHYITLHYITLHYITLHYITLHYITLHYITLHYITLHMYLFIYICDACLMSDTGSFRFTFECRSQQGKPFLVLKHDSCSPDTIYNI